MSSGRIVVGIHPVRELLRAGDQIRHITIADERSSPEVIADIIALAGERGVTVDRVPRSAIDDRAAGLVHQGVLADAASFAFATLDDVLARANASPRAALLVAVDSVTDPHNVGSIARTAEAMGAQAMLIPGRRSASITPTVEKAAAGALAHLPVVAVTNLVRTLASLHDAGIWSLGLDADGDATLDTHPLASEPCVLVVGAEGRGLSRLVRQRCDALVRLEMRGHVASLNASVAAGIALYTLSAQR